MQDFLWRCGITALPKALVSRLAGKICEKEFSKNLIRPFAAKFKIDLSETKNDLDNFKNLQEFFTRELKFGAREINQEENSMTSPCDGEFGQCGNVENNLLLQFKSKKYSVSGLLANEYELNGKNSNYAVIYLSPKDYHRFHAPCDLKVADAYHIPGGFWPVNKKAVKNIENLFCINDRVVLVCENPNNKNESSNKLYFIAVGATVVGKIKFIFDDIRELNSGHTSFGPCLNINIKKGEELGRFEFGSTVILLAEEGFGNINVAVPGQEIKLGEKIGILS